MGSSWVPQLRGLGQDICVVARPSGVGAVEERAPAALEAAVLRSDLQRLSGAALRCSSPLRSRAGMGLNAVFEVKSGSSPGFATAVCW